MRARTTMLIRTVLLPASVGAIWMLIIALAGCDNSVSAPAAATSEAEEPGIDAADQALSSNAVPYQFIAKMYSEALGRAPDPGGWQAYVNYFNAVGCDQNILANIAVSIFSSAEYLAKGYSPEEQTLTLYRAVLSREPDAGGFSTYVNAIRYGAWSAASVAQSMTLSDELASMVGTICAGQGYRIDGGWAQAMDIGGGTWSSEMLQSCVNSNVVCSVPQRTVVYVTSPIYIPAGHLLETAGNPGPTMYARQARLVRAFYWGVPEQSLVVLAGDGAAMRQIWVSGQRHLYMPYATEIAVQANVHHTAGWGNYIWECRVEFPLRGTNIQVEQTGSLWVLSNLIVSYTSSHYMNGYATYPWSDGVSFHAPYGLVAYNSIIDPSDVGIVLFGHDGTVQSAEAHSNTIVHAGHSAYGSLGFDTIYNCNDCQFSGPGIHDNLILMGQSQHSDVMLIVGTGPWYPPLVGGQFGMGRGSGAAMWNNRTIWGDELQRTRVQQGIVVDGMINAYVQGNGLYVSPEAFGACYVPGVSGYRVDSHDAGGSLQGGYFDAPTHGCIGH